MIFEGLDLNTIRIIISLAMLSIASLLDIRKREINDLLWIGFGAIAVLMIFLSGDLWTTLKTTGIAMIIAPVAILLCRLGIFGEADALCLITLAALAPLSTLTGNVVTPITPLTNAALVSVLPLFINLGRNLSSISKGEDIFSGIEETRLNKLLAIFLGYRAKSPKYSFLIEKMEGNKRRLDFGLRHAETSEFCTLSERWVTPGIPYVVYIAAGFVIQLVYGDLIVNLMNMGH